MKKLEMIKTVGGIIVSVGVSTIVGNIIKSTTNPFERTGTFKKLCVCVGGIVLTGVISDKAVEYTEKKIDSAISGTKKMIEETEKKEEVV